MMKRDMKAKVKDNSIFNFESVGCKIKILKWRGV